MAALKRQLTEAANARDSDQDVRKRCAVSQFGLMQT